MKKIIKIKLMFFSYLPILIIEPVVNQHTGKNIKNLLLILMNPPLWQDGGL